MSDIDIFFHLVAVIQSKEFEEIKSE